MTRGRARETIHHVARKLRKGRERCTATRRDGLQCEAPAAPELQVCRRHGGGTQAAQIASERRQLQLRLWVALREYEAAIGTPRQFDMLLRMCRAGDALDAWALHEVRLAQIEELAARLAEQRPARRGS